MTAAEIVRAIEAEGVTLTATDAGKVRFDRTPSARLLEALVTNKSEVLDLLTGYVPGPCACAIADGGLPEGLVAIVDARGRRVGWTLDPAWKADDVGMPDEGSEVTTWVDLPS